MSTPPYFPPSIGPAGLKLPTYQSILADNLQSFLNIYGTNQYVAPDSAIYQLLSAISLKQADVNLALQLAYNQSSPQTAVGAGLDRQVKMNGLARDPYSYSSVLLTLSGDAGTIIPNGFAQDNAGNLWALPSTVTLPGSGSINVTAICTTPGAVTASSGTINIISTPVAGWNSVINAAAAVAGLPVETDSRLRARQAISVALPSTTPIASTIAAVLAADGVVRVAPGYPTPGGPGTSIENPTGAVDSWNNPPHSISIVAECNNTLTVAEAIYAKKTIGCFTNGTTTVPVVDKNTGVTESISFYQPTNLAIYILAKLTGYGNMPTSAVLEAVQTALVDYLNSLAIGEVVSIGALYYEVMALNAKLSAPNFGVSSLQVGATAVATTSAFTSASSTITVADSTGIASGQLVVAVGVPAGTVVVGAPSGLTVTISNPTTSAESGVATTFATLGSTDVQMPNFYYAALGSSANVSVVNV